MSSGGELPVGTATFLFTDIEGSTRLERELRERYGEVLGEHRRLLRDAFDRYGGREIDTQGDSFFFLPRACRLVRESGSAARVTVWTLTGVPRDLGRYVVSLLNSLGYRARLQVIRDVGKYPARVGNYQYNPQWGILLSQLWVK